MDKIVFVQGDITELEVDAIVNAANEHLAHGGGVAGAISRKGGPAIQQESNQWIKKYGLVKTGTAAITTAGDLKARYVIHAVGPVMGSGNEDEKLHNATLNTLKLADKNNIQSIAFPAISTGIFGFPVKRCAEIMLETARKYMQRETKIQKIIFCLFDQKTLEIFKNTFTHIERSDK